MNAVKFQLHLMLKSITLIHIYAEVIDFNYDKNGKPIINKDKNVDFVDKKGKKVTSRGYRVDKNGNIIDNNGRKKFDKTHLTSDGDLPKLFNYNGRRFDITDCIG